MSTAKSETEPQPDAENPLPAFFEGLAADCAQEALRAAFNDDGAAARCGRRLCKAAGSCQLIHRPGVAPVCGGGGEASVDKAVFGVWIGCHMVAAFWQQLLAAGRE